MEDNKGNQKIHCDVKSCMYNDMHQNLCELEAINVSPCMNCCSGKAEDESMCASYKVK